MKINRIFKLEQKRYIWLNLLVYQGTCTGSVCAVIDILDNDKIIYCEPESISQSIEQCADMAMLTEQFNEDYRKYNDMVHEYVISGEQLTFIK